VAKSFVFVGILAVAAAIVTLAFRSTAGGPGSFLHGLLPADAPISSINNIDWKEYRTGEARYFVIQIGLKQPDGKKWLVHTHMRARVTDDRGRDFLASCYNRGGQTWNEDEAYPSDVFASFFIDVSDLEDPHLSGLDIELVDFNRRRVDRVTFPRSFAPSPEPTVGTLRAEYRAGVSFENAETPASAEPPGVRY
jgi:hypothetical protein